MSEGYVQYLIYGHAAFGGVALLSGLIALMTTKGNKLHRKGGLIFYYTMLSSAVLALIVSVQPDHVNYFLFVIGIFSAYMILSGKRILEMKLLYKNQKPKQTDFALPVLMLISGVAMILYGIYLSMTKGNIGMVLLVFGGIGIIMAIGDLRLLKSTPTDKKFWLYQHISKMTGGYIAAVTAFLVVNEILPGLWGWLSPTVVGTVYIIYHQRRFRQKGERILAERKIVIN
jgi:uncharacterized membrane protein